jgi:predicted amidophosphoribosyltransferase
VLNTPNHPSIIDIVLREIHEERLVVSYGSDEIIATRPRELRFPRYTDRKCALCGNPLSKERYVRCALCLECHSFQGVNYVGLYHKERKDDLKRGIYGLKDGNRFWADVFGLALSLILVNEPPELKGDPVLVAVPNHPDDHPERDYNPPDMLARRIAVHSPTTYRPNLLVKTEPNEQKSIQDSHSRFEEVAGKFKAVKELNGEQVFIVDDVMTTGATVSTCAKCCLVAGASEVHVLVVGRNYRFLEDIEYG